MKNIVNTIAHGSQVNIGSKERIISTASGVALVTMGIKNKKCSAAKGWSEIATGAYMLFRGITGFCPLNALVHRNTAE